MMRPRGWLWIALLAASCAPRAAPTRTGEVAITVTEDGFQPASAEVPKGQPVTLVFTRKAEKTCITDVVFGRLGKTYPLPVNQPVRVTVAGIDDTLGYVCPEDMYRGVIVAK